MNIIFDLGGVVVAWEPERLVRRFTRNRKTRDTILSGLIRHSDWLELDRGTLSVEEAVKRCSDRTGLESGLLMRFMKSVPSSLVLKPETSDLMGRLKTNGHRLYCLSNMHFESIGFLERTYTFWEFFEGRVISCRVKMVKPEIRIFKFILAEYMLEPEDTVFIDDSRANVEAARSLGIKAIKFEDAPQCEKELSAIGCL